MNMFKHRRHNKDITNPFSVWSINLFKYFKQQEGIKKYINDINDIDKLEQFLRDGYYLVEYNYDKHDLTRGFQCGYRYSSAERQVIKEENPILKNYKALITNTRPLELYKILRTKEFSIILNKIEQLTSKLNVQDSQMEQLRLFNILLNHNHVKNRKVSKSVLRLEIDQRVACMFIDNFNNEYRSARPTAKNQNEYLLRNYKLLYDNDDDDDDNACKYIEFHLKNNHYVRDELLLTSKQSKNMSIFYARLVGAALAFPIVGFFVSQCIWHQLVVSMLITTLLFGVSFPSAFFGGYYYNNKVSDSNNNQMINYFNETVGSLKTVNFNEQDLHHSQGLDLHHSH